MSSPSSPPFPLPFQLSRLITSFWIPQAIYAAAQLGLADALASGPRRSDELATAVDAHPGATHRLLRTLTVLDICRETGDGAFALTELGACLRSDSPQSVRSWALLMGSPMVWPRWGHLVDSVRTGIPAPKLLDGREPFDDIAAHPEVQGIFHRSMEELTRHLAGAVAAAYDFTGVRRIVDVGGGHGALLPPILAAHPEMRGVVFDQPACRDGALRLFAAAGIAERCEFAAGSFFESVPDGADAYVLKSVIHDWDDERSTEILTTCRAAMHDNARLLIVELIVPERLGTSPLDAMIAGADLNMLVMAGGQERTEGQYRAIIAAAGLRVSRIVPTPAAMSVIEARRG